MSAPQVLDGLETADGPSELDPALGVLDGEIAGPLGIPTWHAAVQHGPVAAPPGGDLTSAHGSPVGRVASDHTGVNGSIGRERGVASRAAGSRRSIRHRTGQQDVEVGQMLDDHG